MRGIVVCARCGAENSDGFRFCGNCGASLAIAEPARQARKVVTALFCDVTGYTALGEQLEGDRPGMAHAEAVLEALTTTS